MAISAPPEPRPLRLLIVEDEALIALMLEDILEGLGHQVVAVVGSVRSAQEAIEMRGPEIDAAIVDANLGGQSALPVAEALQARGLPFLIASGYEDRELHRLGFGAPPLRKPYRCDDVKRALEALARR